MSATSTLLPDTGTSKEALALSGISDALTWRHVLEASPDEDFKRPGQRVTISPDLLTKLGLVLTTTNLGMDPEEELWPVY